MGVTFRLATTRAPRNPVQVQRWNASIRGGDDFRVALTVYADQLGTLANVVGSSSKLILRVDEPRTAYGGWWAEGSCGWDYGLGFVTFAGGCPVVTAGYAVQGQPGRINFLIPSATTAGLFRGRYRLSMQVDMPDGEFSQVEGILQIREFAPRYEQVNALPVTLAPAGFDYNAFDNGTFDQPTLPVDPDGFVQLYVPPPGSATPYYGALGALTLGDNGYTPLPGASAPYGTLPFVLA